MKIAITGALGHIGSHLIRTLPPRLGARLVLIDDLSAQRYASLYDLPIGGHRFHEADVTRADLGPLFAGVDVVIHLAAITDATRSFERRAEVDRINRGGTERVARAAADAGARLIFPSSTSVYGTQNDVVDEDCGPDELKPQSPYAESKLDEERLLTGLAADGLRHVTLRLGTIFGPSPGMRFHTAVNKFCWQATLGTPLTVWRTALDQKRPYLDLRDAADAMAHVIERGLFDGRTYNVLTGNHTVRQVVDAIRGQIEDVQVELVDARIMNQLSYDVSDQRIRATGFTPRGALVEGVGATLKMLTGIRA